MHHKSLRFGFVRAAVLLLAFPLHHGIAAQECNTSPLAIDGSARTRPGVQLLVDAMALASDADGDLLTIRRQSHTCQGSVQDQLDGTFVYTPPSGQASEICTVTYTASDRSHTASGTIQLSATDVAPPTSGRPTGDGAVTGYDPEIDPRRFRRHGVGLDLIGYYPGLHTLSDGHNVDPSNPDSATHYQRLFDNLADHNLNLLRTFLGWGQALEDHPWLHPYQRSNDGCRTAHARELGIHNRGCFDLTRFNDDFFDYWSEVLEYAETQGIIVQLALFDGFHTYSGPTNGWERGIVTFLDSDNSFHDNDLGRKYDYYAQPNNINSVDSDNNGSSSGNPRGWYENPAVVLAQKAFVHHAVEHLGGHSNLIWEVANERWTGSGSSVAAAWETAIAQEIRNAEADYGHPGHLIMPIDLPEHRDVPTHYIPGNNNTSNFPDQDFAGLHNDLVSAFNQAEQPLIADNDCCIFPGSTAQRRKKAWTALISGAYPSIFEYRADELQTSFFGDTQEAVTQVGILARFIADRSINLMVLDPADEVLDPTTLQGRPVWARALPGEEVLVYFLQGGTVDIIGLPNAYEALWLNPRTGEKTDELTPGPRFATPQSSGDWVLHIRATPEPPAPPQGPYPGGIPHPVPGTLEAEHYDLGGAGQAYSDSTPGNTATHAYRPEEDVDAITLTFGSMPTVVTAITAGEWIEHTVDVTSSRRYAASLRYSSVLENGVPQDGSLRLQIVDTAGNPTELDQLITLPGHAGYTTHEVAGIDLNVGIKVLRLKFEDPAYNLNWLRFEPLDGPTADDETVTAEACSGSLEIPVLTLLDGDQPAGEVVIVDHQHGAYGTVVRDPSGPPLDDPNSTLLYTPLDDRFCVQGGDTFTYDIARIDDPAILATGTVTVVAPIHAEDDNQQAPSCTEPFTLTLGDLLLNDVPTGEVEVIAIETDDAQHGTLTVNGSLSNSATVLTYDPFTSNFCNVGIDRIGYTIARINDGTRTASANLNIVAPELPDPEAVDDTEQVDSCFGTHEFPLGPLLVNDSPHPYIEYRAFAQPDQGTGTLALTEGIWKFFFTPSATFCEVGESGFNYTIKLISETECTAASDEECRARVTLVAPPRPAAAADGPFFTFRDRSLVIPYGDLINNDDLGVTFGEIATQPTAGAVVDSGNALIYTPTSLTATADSFTYRARAASGRLSEPAAVTLTLGGTAPAAVDDNLLVQPDGSLFIPYSTLVINDPGANTTVTANSGSTHGTLTSTSDGLLYVPAPSFQIAGEDSFTYTLESTDHPGFSSNATVWLEAEAECGKLRVDNFEGLPFAGWDALVEDGGSITTSTAAAASGVYGLEVDIQPNASQIYLEDSSPAFETHVRVGFVFDPSALKMAPNRKHIVFEATQSGFGPTFALRVRRVNDTYQLVPLFYDDAGAVQGLVLADLTAGPQLVQAEWWGASTPGANNGGMRLWINRRLIHSRNNIDNDERFIDLTRLGAPAGLASTTEGQASFDDFISCRGNRREMLRVDDFEGGDLEDWDGTSGAVSVSSAAALRGNGGLDFDITQGKAWIRDESPKAVDRYRLQFDLDPSGLTVPEGERFTLVRAADAANRNLFLIKMERKNGKLQFRLIASIHGSGGALATTAHGWVPLLNAPQTLRLEWNASPAGGLPSGSATVWLDGALVDSFSGLDTTGLTLDTIFIGALNNTPLGTQGHLALDDFFSWR